MSPDHDELTWLREEVKRLRGMLPPHPETHDLVSDLRAPHRYRIWERTPFFTELHAILMRMAADEIDRLKAELERRS